MNFTRCRYRDLRRSDFTLTVVAKRASCCQPGCGGRAVAGDSARLPKRPAELPKFVVPDQPILVPKTIRETEPHLAAFDGKRVALRSCHILAKV